MLLSVCIALLHSRWYEEQTGISMDPQLKAGINHLHNVNQQLVQKIYENHVGELIVTILNVRI